MKIIYTNISPVNSAYTNLNHIFYLKKQKPQKVYLCIWDNFVFEHHIFGKNLDNTTNKVEKLQENVEILEKLMAYLKINYKIIYLSEALNRLFRNPQYLSIFQKVLANIKIEELKKGFELEYIPFSKISLSKINYVIADYFIATYLPELFPELCLSAPNYYLTSERFRIFHNKINNYLKTTSQKYSSPLPVYVKKVPVIINSKSEIIPCIEMSESKVYEIVKEYYKGKRVTEVEIHDLINVLSEALNKFSFKGKDYDLEKLKKKLRKANREIIIETISKNLYNYLNKIRKIIQKESIKERSKSMFIGEINDFEKNIKNLNPLKLKILQYCDGTNTSLDISRITSLNLSTVSTYFTYLKKQGLITLDRKPKRIVDKIVIDLKNIAERDRS